MFRTYAPAAGCRPTWIALAFVVGLLVAAPAYLQTAAPALRAQAAATERLFPNDGGMVLNFIKPDKTADFEEVMAKLKEALQKSDKPERREQAAGWKVLKSTDPSDGNVLYVFIIEPSVKTADYEVSNIIAEGFEPTEANVILQKYSDAYAQGMNIVNLDLIQDLGR